MGKEEVVIGKHEIFLLKNISSWKNGQNTNKKPWKNGQKVVILPWKNGQKLLVCYWKSGHDMIKRKIDRYLQDFFLNDKKALLITGARQIGKTFSIRQFGHEHFGNFVEINFIDNPDLAKVFSEPRNSKEILLRLSSSEREDVVL